MSGEDIELKKIGDYTVTVSPFNGRFTAENPKGNKIEADTLPVLEESIKRQQAADRHFKPIEVIAVEYGRVGRITSRTADIRDYEVYFTFKPSGESKPTRHAINLNSYRYAEYGEHNFVLATESNLAVLAKIESIEAEIRTKEDLIKSFKKQYTDPVTEEMIEAGEDAAAKKGGA